MNELIELIQQLRERAKEHEDLLRANESLVRYVLIDPLLRGLGWDTEDPHHMVPEQTIPVGGSKGRPDYTLFQDGKKMLFIGAKALGKSENLDQHISYCVSQGVPYFAATDGVNWEIYDVFKAVPTSEKVIVQFNINAMEPGDAARKALALWRTARLGESAPQPVVAGSISPTSTPPPVLPTTSQGGTQATSLSLLDVTPHQSPPTKLVDPDGGEHSCETWKDVMLTVAHWLINSQKITAANCPVSLPGARFRYLLHTNPVHENGNSFTEPMQVGTLSLETHASAAQLTKSAVFLIEQFGGGKDFRVEI